MSWFDWMRPSKKQKSMARSYIGPNTLVKSPDIWSLVKNPEKQVFPKSCCHADKIASGSGGVVYHYPTDNDDDKTKKIIKHVRNYDYGPLSKELNVADFVNEFSSLVAVQREGCTHLPKLSSVHFKFNHITEKKSEKGARETDRFFDGYYVMDNGGDSLHNLVEYAALSLKEDQRQYLSNIKTILLDILCALANLNRLGLVHRDVKLGNILFDYETGKATLCDLGSATYTDRPLKTAMATTYPMCAPELLDHMIRNPKTPLGKYGKEIDVWSVGICAMYMICSNHQEIHNNTPTDPLELMKTFCGKLADCTEIFSSSCQNVESIGIKEFMKENNYKIFDNTPDFDANDIIAFAEDCLVANPKDRPLAADLLDHKLFEGLTHKHKSCMCRDPFWKKDILLSPPFECSTVSLPKPLKSWMRDIHQCLHVTEKHLEYAKAICKRFYHCKFFRTLGDATNMRETKEDTETRFELEAAAAFFVSGCMLSYYPFCFHEYHPADFMCDEDLEKFSSDLMVVVIELVFRIKGNVLCHVFM